MFIYIPPPKKETAPLPIPTGNAVPLDVRMGKSFTSEGGTEIFGTLPERSNGPLTVVPDRTTQVKTSGIYNGDITVQPIPEQTVDTSDATATAAQLLSGSTAYVKGKKVSGSMEIFSGRTVGGSSTSALSGDRIIIVPQPGYYDSSSKVVALTPKLIPANIRNGINILGIIGTLEPSAAQRQELNFYSEITTRPGYTAPTSEIFNVPPQANLALFSKLASETGLVFQVLQGSYPSYELEITDGITTLGLGSNNRYWQIDTIVIDKITNTITYKYLVDTTITNRSVSLARLDKTRQYTIRSKLYIDGGGSTWQIRTSVQGTLLLA